MCDLCTFRKLCHCVMVLWKHLLMVTHSELLQYDFGGKCWLQKKNPSFSARSYVLPGTDSGVKLLIMMILSNYTMIS